jgi:serine/threonine-protein kinase
MGAVYEAEGPPGVGKRAIKLLHQEFVKEEIILARFFAESQAQRIIVHPNVVHVFEAATAENGTPYLVMELLQGISVSSYVDQGQILPTPQAVHIAHGVLQALSAAHARGIVHRDIKPDNVFLVQEPNGSFYAKVLDFGIAKVMDAAGGMGQKTRTGVLLGTPGYMSPEQIKNSKGVDGRADLWSVGVIFYELLTGSSPFPADNEFARLTSVLVEELKPVEQVMPHLASWGAFFQRALAKDPAYRFQTADEMASALLATARAPTMRPPTTLQGPQPQGHSPSQAPAQPSRGATPDRGVPPVPTNLLATAAMPLVDPPLSAGAVPVSMGPMSSLLSKGQVPVSGSPASGMLSFPGMLGPTVPQVVMGHNSALAATVTADMAGQIGPLSHVGEPGRGSPNPSGPMSAMPSSMAHAAVVSRGSVPPRGGTLAADPTPDLPSHLINHAASVGPTAVSAQAPPGTPSIHGTTPAIAVIDAPRNQRMAPYWVVAVVAFVAFGLGLAVGILIG